MRVLRGLWWTVNTLRRAVLNALFLLLLGAVLWLLLRPGPPVLRDKTALLLNWQGTVLEQRAGVSPRDGALRQLRGDDEGDQLRLRDVLAVLDAAAQDPKIPHAVLLLDEFAGASLPVLREIGAALDRFKAAGKPVYAWGGGYDQRQYYLAAHATEVWMHPMGGTRFEGFGRYRNYYKDLFDKVGISANVQRVGQFKSAAEAYSANAPSAATVEAESYLFNDLWALWQRDVETARQLPAGSITAGIDALPGSLVAAGGNAAQLAVNEKLVTALMTREALRARLLELGAPDDSDPLAPTFRQVSFGEYAARMKPEVGGEAIAVVVAQGEISDGVAPAGRIGGLSTANIIRRAREDKNIKAVVLRIDSPGGSPYGSEMVRRELELTREAGKPVVVSMGGLAASGGYWISLAADEVIADEATITGSIGVIAMLPTAKVALDKLGVNASGVTTTWLAGAYDIRRELDPRFVTMVQASIQHTYSEFTSLAATARKTTPEKIDEVGQGRVWTGRQALERGLVDRVGSLGDALAAARERAKLPEDVRVAYLEREPGRLQRLLAMLDVRADTALGELAVQLLGDGEQARTAAALGALAAGLPPGVAGPVLEDLAWLARVRERREPYAAVVHCLCTAP
jgi:protease IV